MDKGLEQHNQFRNRYYCTIFIHPASFTQATVTGSFSSQLET